MKIAFRIAVLGLFWSIALGRAQPNEVSPPAARTTPPKQGDQLLKTDILGVFAHPDDETGIAATCARYALGEGKIVAHVYCTRGEGGGNMAGTQWGPALGILREAELRDCLGRLGVRYCYFLDQLDWAYTESVAATLRKWGKEETLRRLVRHIRALRPEIIITMNPAPSPGQHGHHQAAGVLATEAFEAAADPNRFPEQITDEGLTPWQVRKLYYPGSLGENVATISTTNALPDGRTPGQIAAEALANHRSQGFGNFGNSSFLRRPQMFTLVKSVVPTSGPESDLLQGLPIADADAKRVSLGNSPAKVSPVELRFVPRPAIAQYQQWVKEQRIEHVAGRFAADVPVVSGEANVVQIEVMNHGPDLTRGEFQLVAPEGWLWEKQTHPYSAAPGQVATFSMRLTPPAGSRADAELSATTRVGEAMLKAVASAHPVPRGKVVRLNSAPRLDASGQGWEQVPATFISPTNLVQGKVASDADSSAWFRLAHDGQTLFVDVDVKDDHVVSNIAPNDIRGHWRSDSVEICLDPAAGAEDTMGCFKLGIFPFDTTGVVRAARDADANQGPIETTAPGTRIASRRTADGYRIQAAIPLREIGVSLEKSRRLGFNLIIYDGDKTDAALGENINKSRIAWSPRPGVNGRPEDWGRVDLE
jgi:LmbE family N-acetylglucosaminyl deacetylase